MPEPTAPAAGPPAPPRAAGAAAGPVVAGPVVAGPVVAEPVRGGLPDPALVGLPGWQQITAYGTRLLPRSPIGRLLGLGVVGAEPGRARYRLPLTPWWRDATGRVSPAVVAVLADAALAGGVVSGLPAGHARMATVDLSLHYLGADLDALLDAGEELVATGRPIGPAGPGLVPAELEVRSATGRPVVRGLGHCLVLPALDPVPPAPRIPGPEAESGDDPYQRAVEGEDPLAHLLGLAAVDSGLSMPASPWLLPAAPAIQGGALVMLAQLAAERAVTAEQDRPAVVAQITASFLRMAFPREAPLTARATATRHSRNLATAAVRLTDEAGRALLDATTTCYRNG